MSKFPRTEVGGVSLPRLICGTNWFLGYSHTSHAKDRFIRELFDVPAKMAKVVEVFARHGCNAVMAGASQFVFDALREVEQRTGEEMIYITTPSYSKDGNPDSWEPAVDEAKKFGGRFCFPHQSVTDLLIDVGNRCLSPRLIEHLSYVRKSGMIPGLSTHMAEAVSCSDTCGADIMRPSSWPRESSVSE